MDSRCLGIRERIAEIPWIVYFITCAIACCAGLVAAGYCRLLWHACARLAGQLRYRSLGHGAGVLFIMLLLAGCERTLFVWQGPSQSYLGHDIDGDSRISREEWERGYGTSASEAAVLDFDRGDCDRNGRLTWEEYFELRGRSRRCPPGALEVLQSGANATAEARTDTLVILNAREINQAWLSLVRNRQRLVAAKFHEDYSEQDLPPGTGRLFRLTCGSMERLEIPSISQDFREISRVALLAPGPHPARRCTVENFMRDDTITCLRLRIGLPEDRKSQMFHVKTLWVPPSSTRDIWILPGAGATPTTIELMAVRVKAQKRNV